MFLQINSEKGVARANFVAAVNKNRIQWETMSSSTWLITTMTQTDIINCYKLCKKEFKIIPDAY